MTNIWLHFSLGRADRMALWTMVEAVLIGVAVTAGLHFGAPGVAWGYTVSMYLLCITGLWYAGRPVSLTLREILAVLWQPAAAAVIAGCACWYFVLETGFVHAHAARLVLFCASFGTVYFGFIVMLGGGINTIKFALTLRKTTGPISTIGHIFRELLTRSEV
jgi:hypothetical protein